ncbi:MAG: hypothetical protein U9O59_07500, partial [Actinomycetota bacterium]|nr:hypothetical protein [Actinomycetota bacterium]
MINLELASILTDIAEVKKSGDSDRTIVPNLIGAARTLRDMPERVDQIYNNGNIRDLHGMEEPALGYVMEYLEKGSIGFYERLKSRYGEDLIRLIRVSGLGKRKMFKVYDTLNAGGLKELKEKLSCDMDGRVLDIISEDISGSGRSNPFYLDRLKDSINYMEGVKGLYPRWRVKLYINEIKSSLLKIKSIEKVEVVGSLRRKKPAVRDIDVLILPDFNGDTYDLSKSEKLLEELKSLEFIKKIRGKDIRKGSASARFETDYGIEVEFIISSGKSWALDMLYTTGSKKHIKKLEEEASRKGYTKNGRIAADSILEGSEKSKGNL